MPKNDNSHPVNHSPTQTIQESHDYRVFLDTIDKLDLRIPPEDVDTFIQLVLRVLLTFQQLRKNK